MDKRDKRRKEKKKQDAEYRERRRVEEVRKATPLTVVGAETRPCGECQACCEVIAVGVPGSGSDAPFHKPNYTRCEHQCGTGCGVYASRPKECREYYCLYQAGFLTGGEEMRPDRLGVVIDFRTTLDAAARDVLVFWEVWPGAGESPAVRDLIARIRAKTPFRISVMPYGHNWEKSDVVRLPVL